MCSATRSGQHVVRQCAVDSSRWVRYLGSAVVWLAAIVFFSSVLPSCRIFPYSDEWNYIQPMTSYSNSALLRWLIEQHVDHRIPLQKSLHAVTLRLFGFDFRSLIGLNFLVACLVALLLMKIAREYRGVAAFGDLLIPACLLSFGTGFSLWGFEFQFLSSTFFVTLFLFLTLSSELAAKPSRFNLAL